MPYAESLETFAEWFAQLWAESLGKDGTARPDPPARSARPTSTLSSSCTAPARRTDKLVSLIRPTERAETEIPETDLDGLAASAGSSLGDLLDAERRPRRASRPPTDVPNLRVEIDRVDEGLGELLYAMEAACVLYGELASVSTFTQPAVEWGRRRLGDCSAAAISPGGRRRGRQARTADRRLLSRASRSVRFPRRGLPERLTHRALNHQR